MSTLTIAIPSDVFKTIEKHSEIDWKAIAQKSLIDYAKKLAITDSLLSQSDFSESDIAVLDKEIKDTIAKKYL